MTSEIQEWRRKQNQQRRNQKKTATDHIATSKQVSTLMGNEAKRNAWRNHLGKIAETNSAKNAWPVVKCMPIKEKGSAGKMLTYYGAIYASDSAKAVTFIHEYATINVNRSDRPMQKSVHRAASDRERLAISPFGKFKSR